MVNYDKIDIVINNRGVIADSISIVSTSAVEANPILGYRNNPFSTRGQVSSTVQMSYLLRANGDPNLELIQRLKNYDFSTNSVRIQVAGLVGTFHLTQFSFSVSPNEPVKASATYVSFEQIGGQLERSEGLFDFEDGNYVNILHGWATYVTSTGNYLDVPAYNLQYDFSVDWRPAFVLGQKEASMVVFGGAREKVEFERDDFLHVNFSGELGNQRLFSGVHPEKDVALKGLVFVWDSNNDNTAFDINLKNAVITQTRFGVNANDYGRSSVTMEQSY
jgi:hypothetical protein